MDVCERLSLFFFFSLFGIIITKDSFYTLDYWKDQSVKLTTLNIMLQVTHANVVKLHFRNAFTDAISQQKYCQEKMWGCLISYHQ